MYIQNENLLLRSLAEDDKGIDFAGLGYDDLQTLTERHLHDVNLPSEMKFAVEAEGKLAGEISLKTIRWFNHKAELSVFILKEFRGQGLAERAMRMLLDHAFGTMNFFRLEAEVVAYNPAAKALFEKLGFTREGTLRKAKYFDGSYHDIFVFGLLAEEWLNKGTA